MSEERIKKISIELELDHCVLIFITAVLKQSVDHQIISNPYMDNCQICKNKILGPVCHSALGNDKSGKIDGFIIHFAVS